MGRWVFDGCLRQQVCRAVLTVPPSAHCAATSSLPPPTLCGPCHSAHTCRQGAGGDSGGPPTSAARVGAPSHS